MIVYYLLKRLSVMLLLFPKAALLATFVFVLQFRSGFILLQEWDVSKKATDRFNPSGLPL